MRLTQKNPPRVFKVGRPDRPTELKDCAEIALEPNEQVTFVTTNGAQYDVAYKSWGFYATPSLNGRLQKFGWRAALARNAGGKFYIFLVEKGKESDFQRYATLEDQEVVCWLDSDEALETLERKLKR